MDQVGLLLLVGHLLLLLLALALTLRFFGLVVWKKSGEIRVLARALVPAPVAEGDLHAALTVGRVALQWHDTR